MMPARLRPDPRAADRAGGRSAAPGALSAALTLLAVTTALTGCSRPPELTGVRVVPVDSTLTWTGPPYFDDLRSQRFEDAKLRGPHYTLGVSWIAVGEQLDRDAAERLKTSPVRAAAGEKLLIAAVDPEETYAAFDRTPKDELRVEAVVSGKATVLDGLPLAPQRGLAPRTALILISAGPGAAVQLRATDAGRAEMLDLRTGDRLTANGKGYQHRQSDVRWNGESPAAVNRYGRTLPVKLSASNAPFTDASTVASLTTYRPTPGWAAPGRAFLTVPAPALVGDLPSQGVHVESNDAAMFTFRTTGGLRLPAKARTRDIDLTRSHFGPPGTITFDVPADVTAGTVVFDAGRARLTEEVGPATVRQASPNRRPISWSVPPRAFTLPLDLS